MHIIILIMFHHNVIVLSVLLFRASVLIQYIYEELDFSSPFFLTYIATSLLAFHLPAWFLYERIKQWTDRKTDSSVSEDSASLLKMNIENSNENKTADNQEPIDHINVIKIAIIISPIWFLANCLYNYSLLMTSVSSSL